MLRKKFSDTPIPRSFRKQSDAYKIVKEFDIKVTGRGRMALKLLIFKNPKDMCLFWKKTLGRDLGGSIKKGYEAQGCVSALMHDNGALFIPPEAGNDRARSGARGLCLRETAYWDVLGRQRRARRRTNRLSRRADFQVHFQDPAGTQPN